MEAIVAVNTLQYDEARCIGCGLCTVVCPHGVFSLEGRRARIVRDAACIECGACQRNCPVDAIQVDTGPGCAAALIRAALTGGEPTCGPTSCGCGEGQAQGACPPADCACGAPATGEPADAAASCCAPSRGGWPFSRQARRGDKTTRCC